MIETVIRLSRELTLVAHPRHRTLERLPSRLQVLQLLRGTSENATTMMSLRRSLVPELSISLMTNQQVLAAIATKVSHGAMELRLADGRPQAKVKFSDLLKNYPTNDRYPTTTDSEPNIWKLVGGKVYYNAVHKDPSTGKPIFANSCATRMSRALNYSGAPVEHAMSGTASGADGKWYLFRVSDLDPEMRKLFGTPRTLTLSQQKWRKEIEGETGVLKFTASWADATGHFTLWTGASMVNVPEDDRDAAQAQINGVFFWRVK